MDPGLLPFQMAFISYFLQVSDFENACCFLCCDTHKLTEYSMLGKFFICQVVRITGRDRSPGRHRHFPQSLGLLGEDLQLRLQDHPWPWSPPAEADYPRRHPLKMIQTGHDRDFRCLTDVLHSQGVRRESYHAQEVGRVLPCQQYTCRVHLCSYVLLAWHLLPPNFAWVSFPMTFLPGCL